MVVAGAAAGAGGGVVSPVEGLTPPSPTRTADARPGSLYGLALAVLVLAVIVGSLVFAYVYLAVNSRRWPPAGVDPPSWTPGLLLVALAISAAVAATAAHRSAAGARGGAVIWLATSAVLGAGATAFGVVAVTELPSGATEQAYGASVVALGGSALLLTAAGSLGAALVAVWAATGSAGRPPGDAERLLRGWWWSTVAMAAVAVGVVLLGGRWG